MSDNLLRAKKLVRDAALDGAEFVFLPESVDFFSELKQAEPIDGPFVTDFQRLSKELNVWISLGESV